MFYRPLTLVCALLLSVSFLLAQGNQNRAQAVMPWVSEDTVWVAVGSLDGIDLDAAGKWITNAAAQTVEPADVESSQREIAKVVTFLRGLREELKTAGVKEVYCLFDAHPQRREQVLCVIPAGANAEAVAGKLRPMLGQRMELAVEQNAVVILLQGSKAERRPQAARPEVATALASSDAPVVFALTLPQDLRNAMPPALPERMGGTDLAPIQDGFMWAAADLRFTPEPALHAVAQMDGAANAKGAVQVVQTVLDAEGKAGGDEAKFFALASQWLLPQAKEDLLVIDLPSARLNDVVAQLAPSLRQARHHAKQIQSASQVRQLLMGVHMFASENKGATPEQLDQVEKYLGGAMPWLLTNPQRPETKPGYVYLKQSMGNGAASDKVMLYEAYDTWPGGINVGYVDGHVEWIANEATFLAQLKASGGAK